MSATLNPMVVRDVPCDPRIVLIQDRRGVDARFVHSTLGRVRRERHMGATLLEVECVLPAGDVVLVPAGFVHSVPRPAIMAIDGIEVVQ